MKKMAAPGAPARATGDQFAFQAAAGGNSPITSFSTNGTCYRITPPVGEPFSIIVKGRDQWALEQLRAASDKGCTPIDNPAPRWSAYVFNLRGHGVEIETVREPHGGAFAGHHGRYVLRCGVEPDGKAVQQ